MLCCLNPDCDRPINQDGNTHCLNCGTGLVDLLHKRFKVNEPIGRGGFGKTYLAEDTHKLNDRCVVKQLAYQGEGTRGVQQKVVQLFEQEAKQLQKLGENPQIPTLLAYFEEDSYLYLVQQFIEGDNLLKQLELQGKYSGEQIQQLLLDILPILQFVHDRGTIHRDIKPENIMLHRKDNKPFLIDFGVSKLLSQTVVVGGTVGTSLGSHGYSPPEQIKEGKALYASDLFALGATCFHLMSDIHPFHLWADHGYSWVSDWRKHISNPISPQLGFVMDKLLQKDMHNRYQSANEVLQDLRSNPSISPTVPFPTARVSTPQTFYSSDSGPTPQSGKGWAAKLAVAVGVGVLSLGIVVSLKVNEQKVGLSAPPNSNTTTVPVASQPESAPVVVTPSAGGLTAETLFDRAIDKRKNGDIQGAIDDYTKAIEIDPKYVDAYNNRGNARSTLGDKQGAIADYNKAIELNPTYARAYSNRGLARADLGDKQAAIVDYNKAIELDPNYALAYYNRANARDDLGDKQGAIVDYTKSIELDPSYVDSYYNRGVVRFALGDKQGAKADYTKAIEIDPKYVSAYYNRGNILDDLGNKQAAFEDYNKAIELKPDHANAYFNRAFVRVGLSDKQGAIRDYNKAAELYQKAGLTKDYQNALDRAKKLQQQ